MLKLSKNTCKKSIRIVFSTLVSLLFLHIRAKKQNNYNPKFFWLCFFFSFHHSWRIKLPQLDLPISISRNKIFLSRFWQLGRCRFLMEQDWKYSFQICDRKINYDKVIASSIRITFTWWIKIITRLVIIFSRWIMIITRWIIIITRWIIIIPRLTIIITRWIIIILDRLELSLDQL